MNRARATAAALAFAALLSIASTAGAATRISPATRVVNVVNPPKAVSATTSNGLVPKPGFTPVKPPTITTLTPTSVNLSAYAMPTGDQGNEGSCEAWAVEYGLLGWYANKFGRGKPLYKPGARTPYGRDWFHPMMGFHNYGTVIEGKVKLSDPDKGQPYRWGAYLDDGFKEIQNFGAPPSTEYTARGTWDYFHPPSLAEYVSAARYKVKTGLMKVLFLDYEHPTTSDGLKAIKQQLMLGRPVVLAVGVGDDFMNNSSGLLVGSDDAAYEANHAILALGYDSGGLLLQNSWGTDWGKNGWVKITWSWALKGVFGAISLGTSADPFLMAKGS